ncbi:Uncharacterised protein [Mycobacteroides abscessus subsp. abscessus]|nr:Uncharacterised protein [Mycobacteroides abscessus subsp. abscessus]
MRGVSPSRGPTTCVLSASRRNAALCRTRARSRAKSVRYSEAGMSTTAAALGDSVTTRSRSESV